jgi:hypothetical protein
MIRLWGHNRAAFLAAKQLRAQARRGAPMGMDF